MAERAHITPEILKWARDSAKISIDTAAKKIKVSEKKIQDWEEGLEAPTIKQAMDLAKFYKRSFSIFFLSKPPKDFLPLKDYRAADSAALDTASIFMIRDIQQKQIWLREFFIDNNENKLPFVGKFSISDNPSIVAKDILKVLDIAPNNYSTKKPLNEWIQKSEKNGIFISRTSFVHTRLLIDKNIIQGFTIADEYAPFIFLNSKEWDAPQLFTLVHELAHIWIAKSGISNNIEIDFINKPKSKIDPVERFCNKVASIALMPEDIMKSLDKKKLESYNNIFEVCKNLGVSTLSFLHRSFDLKLINEKDFLMNLDTAQKRYLEYLDKEEQRKREQKKHKKNSGPNANLLKLYKNSINFTRVVIDSYKSGIINPTTASNLLQTKINNFQKFEKLMAT